MFTDFRERRKERERNIDWLLSIYTPTRDQTCNPDVCPDQELNPQPLGVWDHTPTNCAIKPGQKLHF